MKNIIISIVLFSLISCSGNKTESNIDIETNSKNISQHDADSTAQIKAKSDKNYQEYYDNGALKIEGNNDINGNRSGLWVSYYENGIKWSETYYRKGLKDGHSITFYPNGQIRFIGEYKDDIKTGEWTFNDEDGHPTSTETY